MNTAIKLVTLSVATVALWGFSSLAASARVVCNADGDCWHIHEDYTYPPAGRRDHPSGRLALEGRRAPRLARTSRARLLERRRVGAVLETRSSPLERKTSSRLPEQG